MSEFAHTVLRAGSHVVRLARRVTPLLVPGSGWSGATAQPDAVGDSQAVGYNAKAIARWDVVPFQTFAGTMNVGVVAFHIEGINRVEFSVNGGLWRAATSMRLNPTTGVAEYFVALRASDFADGPVEVRAIAYPTIGEPRVLAGALPGTHGEHSLFLNVANGVAGTRYVSTSGSDSNNGLTPETPMLTIGAARDSLAGIAANTTPGGTDIGNCEILLAAGTYSLGRSSEFNSRPADHAWLTVRPMDGLTRADVTISAMGNTSGIRMPKICLRGMTINTEVTTQLGLVDYLWFDDCLIQGSDRTTMTPAQGNWTGWYCTNSTIQRVRNALRNCLLARNVTVDEIGEDAFGYLTINCSATDIDPTATAFHPDVLQMFGGAQNVIMYGVTANDGIIAQGIFHDGSGTIQDVAIVNVTLQNSGSYYAFQLLGPTSNMLIKDSTIGGGEGAAWRTDQGFTAENVVVDNVTWTTNSPGAEAGVTYRN